MSSKVLILIGEDFGIFENDPRGKSGKKRVFSDVAHAYARAKTLLLRKFVAQESAKKYSR